MIGVGIVSFDRPHYLAQLLHSLAGQFEPPEMDFHLWQDGAVNRYSGRQVGDQERIDESRRLFAHSGVPGFKMAHVRQENVGIGINQFEAYEWMCQYYEQVVMLEDDVVLSPYWARLLPVLFDELAQHPDTFGFTTGFRRWCEKGEIERYLDQAAPGRPHWWMIAFTPQRWARVRPHFLRYYDLIRDCDYGAIPHGAIVKLFEEVNHAHQASSQDGGKDMALHCAGMHRVRTTVNRGVSIGREGVHFNPRLFERMGFHNQKPYVFESDRTRNHFDWMEAR